MNVLRRIAEVLTWKHFAGVAVIVVTYILSARIAMVGNDFNDGTTLESLIGDAAVHLTFALVYLAAIVIVEATSAARTGPTITKCALGVAAAGIVTMSLAYSGYQPPYPGFAIPGRYSAETQVAFEARKATWRRYHQARASGLLSAPKVRLRESIRVVAVFSLVSFAYVWVRRSRQAWRSLAEAELARSEAQRKLVAERLSSAQAAADPAEILDRLTEIEHAYECDPPRADAMMDELITFLREAIPRFRADAVAPPSHEAQGSPG